MLSEHVCPHNFHGTEPHRTEGAGKLVGAVPPPVVALQRLGAGNPPATVLAASLVAEKRYVLRRNKGRHGTDPWPTP